MIIMTIIVALIMYQNVEDRNRAVLFLLLCYFLWNVWTMRQLTKSRADTVMELERSTVLIQCVTELSSHEDVDQAINNLLKIVTEYFQGDRTYIFEMDYEEKLVHNTYEYAAAGVTKEIENLRDVPIQIIQTWIDMFHERRMFYISDLDREKEKEDARAYEVLKAQNINSLIAVPFKKNGVVTGFFGVDNPREHYRDFELLSSIQFFIMNRLETRSRQEQLQYLSYRDMLTNLYNRNCYIRFMEGYRGQKFENIGVVYIDLNGLKKVNDEQGHEAGDSFIRRAAQQIVAVFPEHTYRIGGDEFVVLSNPVEKNAFLQEAAKLRDCLCEHEAGKSDKAAVGACWSNNAVYVEEVVNKAESEMYESKKQYYKKRRRKIWKT